MCAGRGTTQLRSAGRAGWKEGYLFVEGTVFRTVRDLVRSDEPAQEVLLGPLPHEDLRAAHG